MPRDRLRDLAKKGLGPEDHSTTDPELCGFILVANPLLSVGIHAFHVIDNVQQCPTRARVLRMLRTIFATVHLGLVLGDDRLRVRIALAPYRHSWHVAVHEIAIATQIASP